MRDTCLKNQDLSSYFQLIKLMQVLCREFGAAAFVQMHEVCFSDNDLNICDLVNLIARLILQKCDKTEINLQDNKMMNLKASNAAPNLMMKSGGNKR
jgi:hypothetical protein